MSMLLVFGFVCLQIIPILEDLEQPNKWENSQLQTRRDIYKCVRSGAMTTYMTRI